MTNNHYDLFVIGSGSGGMRTARFSKNFGAKVGMCEVDRFGGTCVNIGCVPKKLMSYAAEYSGFMNEAKAIGWHGIPQDSSFSWPEFIQHKTQWIEGLSGRQRQKHLDLDIDVINGFGKLIDKNTVDIDGTVITADHILIATGLRPRIPSFKGGDLMLTSDDVFFMNDLPKNILVYGGGYVAVEFAGIFNGMGAKTSVAYRGTQLMRKFDHDIAESLAEEMQKKGISIYFEHSIQSIEKNDQGRLEVAFENGHTASYDMVMNAVGRDANTDKLNLDIIGVETKPNGEVVVNEDFETSVPGVYALGDITNAYKLTPVAIAEGAALARRLFGKEPDAKVNYDYLPSAVFSKPPLSAVGLTEKEAKEQGYEIDIHKIKFTALKFSFIGKDEKTQMKVIVDKKTDRVLGCHMMGQDAPEIMQGFAVALNAGATYADFKKTIGIHPTAAEEFVTM